jgi:hypothetical protein
MTPAEEAASIRDAGIKRADEEGIGKAGSMGRITDARAGDVQQMLDTQKAGIADPRQAEMNALLALQQAGLGGMTPAEIQAAREQGMAGINQQLATNMKQFGDVAAGNGVRGGSAMGLQMQALGQAQDASGQLSRQLILDNLAQKNINMDRYGNTLSKQQATELGQKNIDADRYGNTLQHQQGVELGIQDKNLGLSAAEMAAREAAITGFGSQIDSISSGRKSDAINKEMVDIVRGTVNETKDAAKTKEPTIRELAAILNNPSSSPEDKAAAKAKLDQLYLKSGTKSHTGPDIYNDRSATVGPAQGYKQAAEEDTSAPVTLTLGDKTYYRDLPGNADPQDFTDTYTDPETGRTYYNPKSLTDQGKSKAAVVLSPAGKQYKDAGQPQPGCAPGAYCYVMTAARDAGLLDQDLYATTVAKCPTKAKYAKAYAVWGLGMARLMRRSPRFARAIAWLVPDTLKVLKGQPSTVKGYLAYYGIYVPLSKLSNLYLMVRRYV